MNTGKTSNPQNLNIDTQVVGEGNAIHGCSTMVSFTANAPASQGVKIMANVSLAICLC